VISFGDTPLQKKQINMEVKEEWDGATVLMSQSNLRVLSGNRVDVSIQPGEYSSFFFCFPTYNLSGL
jgi:hypothetical protein